MMQDKNGNSKPRVKRVSIGSRYPEDRVALLDAVRVRWGKSHLSDVVAIACDRVLKSEGLLDEAA